MTDFVLHFNVLTVASAIPGANECNPSGGSSWLYEISVANGTAANGTTVSSSTSGAFLVVGMSAIMATDGNLRQIIVGSDARCAHASQRRRRSTRTRFAGRAGVS